MPQIKAVERHVAGEVQIFKSISVEVTNRHAGAVRKVLIQQQIPIRTRVLHQHVRKIHPRALGRQTDKQLLTGRLNWLVLLWRILLR